ncbi:MAG: hypothetical protein ACLRWQ_13380 [Flavonifractor plautii]
MARTKAISLIQTGSTKVELSELSGLVISNIQKETLAAGLKSQSYTGNPATGSVERQAIQANSASRHTEPPEPPERARRSPSPLLP